MRCYKVMVKRGHCGSGNYLPITFTFVAENIIEAMDRAKAMPGVKHSADIISASEVTWQEYTCLRGHSAYSLAERKEGMYERNHQAV